MSREKIGTITAFEEKDKKEGEFKSEVTIQLSGELEKNDRVALLGPVAYTPAEVAKIELDNKEIEKAEENDEVKLTVTSDEKINIRENTTAYKMS